jgi:hypothetical protein
MPDEVTMARTPLEAFECAIIYFGPAGAGLRIVSQTPQSLVFQDGGGQYSTHRQTWREYHPGAGNPRVGFWGSTVHGACQPTLLLVTLVASEASHRPQSLGVTILNDASENGITR